MGAEDQFLKVLSKHGQRRAAQVTIGTVKEILQDNYTCTISRDDRPELQGVRLNACEFEGNRFVTIPKIGSEVLVCLIDDNPAEAYLLACSEVGNVIITIGETKLKVSDSGHEIAKGSENLKSILIDLVDQVIKIGAFKDVPGLVLITQRLNNLLQ